MKIVTKSGSRARVGLAAAAIAACACIGIAAACALFAQQGESASSASLAAPHAFAKKKTVAGVKNFGEISPELFRGAQPTREGFEQLQQMGVGIVVDLRDDGGKERAEVTKLGMQYVQIPWHCYDPLDASVAQFLTLVRDNPGKKVFVHCRLGTDRTGMMVAAYRMSRQGWSAQEARKEMEAFGYSFEHHVICPGLGHYEKEFPHEYSTSPAFDKLRSSPAAPAPTQP